MSEYQLDVATWRCGNGTMSNSYLGKGRTSMLNDQGYMCCLGQFAKQKGVPDDVLLNKGFPGNIGLDYDPVFCYGDEYGEYKNTKLAWTLMKINDVQASIPKVKIDRIREELEKEGHTLNVVNEHLLDDKS